MTSDNTSPMPQPADPPRDEIVTLDEDVSPEADTEGHSMVTPEFVRTVNNERTREAERIYHESARSRAAGPSRDGGLLRRFRRH
jgi:hypothetical protein